jgi:hypothetical protein
MTRATPTGGAYTLDATSSAGVAESARQALEGIAGRCNGVYEITALEKLSQPVRHLGYYLEPDGTVGHGPYRTQIDFECRAPQSEALNDLVHAVARRAP